LALYRSGHDPNYILSPDPDTATIVGGVLEIIVALACIGTAVALYAWSALAAVGAGDPDS
jgi:hypothetical protein